MNYCVVRVIFAARFENTWPAHSANFENGMETGLNILFSQIGKIIMIDLSIFNNVLFHILHLYSKHIHCKHLNVQRACRMDPSKKTII